MIKIMRMITVNLLILVSSLFFVNTIISVQAYAAPCQPKSNILGIPTWYKYLDGQTDETGRCNPVLSDSGDPDREFNAVLPIGIAILEIFIRLGGLVAVVMILIGSFKFITSQGSPDAAASARKTIINSLIGLGIVIVSTTVVTLVGNALI